MIRTQYFAGGGVVMAKEQYFHDPEPLFATNVVRSQKPLFLAGYVNLTYEESIILEQAGRTNFGPIGARRYRR